MNAVSLLGGLAGAGALTLINQTMKQVDHDAPRLDLLGQNTVAKLVKGNALPVSLLRNLMPAAMVGDLVSNSMYFSMAQAPTASQTYVRGAVLGAAAGIGAVVLAKPLGVDSHVGEQPMRTKVMTFAYYLIGGMVAAAMINLITKR